MKLLFTVENEQYNNNKNNNLGCNIGIINMTTFKHTLLHKTTITLYVWSCIQHLLYSKDDIGLTYCAEMDTTYIARLNCCPTI